MLALADSANDEGVCWPSIAALAVKAGIGHSTAEQALRSLETDGLVERNHRKDQSSLYQIHLDRLPPAPDVARPAPRETHGTTPRGSHGSPPVDLTGDPRGSHGENPKGTQKRNPKDFPDAAAPEQQSLPLSLPAVVQKPVEEDPSKVINKRAVKLAQWYYERIGGMGNVAAFIAVIKQAVVRDFTDQQITVALGFLAERRWTLTAERLAHTLNGGPRPASAAPMRDANGRDPRKHYTIDGRELQV